MKTATKKETPQDRRWKKIWADFDDQYDAFEKKRPWSERTWATQKKMIRAAVERNI